MLLAEVLSSDLGSCVVSAVVLSSDLFTVVSSSKLAADISLAGVSELIAVLLTSLVIGFVGASDMPRLGRKSLSENTFLSYGTIPCVLDASCGSLRLLRCISHKMTENSNI